MSTGYLVVDLGGVVCHFDHARRLERLARACALGTEQIHALLWQSGFSADCDQGRYASAALVRTRIRVTLGIAGTDDEIDDAWCSAFLPHPTVIDVLDRHRGDRVLALFTNNGPLEEHALTRRYPDVFGRFDHLFFSHRLRHRKPDPAAFTAVAGHLGAPSDEITFIDDSPGNVAAARKAGWHSHQYHDVALLRHDLAEAEAVNGRRTAR
ncbi:HAD family phosphatase [Dactylosporangium sp. NPDC050588]|uniref:HAD family hydrolase n=1 Tax=Dactylosporangium sp. NPDC050588 TaxID=3157211 RepID=UPI0033EBAE45